MVPPRRLPGWLAACGAFAGVGCVLPVTGPPSLPPSEMRDRMRAVEVGQSRARVHERLGALPVRKPGHPEDPFPTPLRVAELVGEDGTRVVVEVYVVATRPAEGCPDVHYDDLPVAFVDGRVAGLSWEFVEWRWRSWGGSLADLRAFQDRLACSAPAADAAVADPGA